MRDLVRLERNFAAATFKTPESRAFFRHWRRAAASHSNAWADIREAKFIAGGKKIMGAQLVTKLRNHLVSLQGGCCCYCRRPLQGIGWAKPIDHVLPKAQYPRYTFHYRNLAVACYDCNQVKKNNDWSGWGASKRKYIPEKRCQKFFHPRYHVYDDHVRYLHISSNGTSVSVYVGTTEQGRKLCLDLLHKSAGKQLALTANPRLDKALTNIKHHAEAMEKHAVAGRLNDFLVALEAFVVPGI